MIEEREPTLYIVATPIGNLGDITLRALETLKTVDLILCEDTRVTKKLLVHYGISKQLMSYHQQSNVSKIEKIISALEQSSTLALVTDAGTPGVSDPGGRLIASLREHFGKDGILIVPIPGPSALTALIQVSGVDLSKFVFLGFPPNKKGRDTFFKQVANACYPVCYYDSPYRVIKNLQLLNGLAGQSIEVTIGRELTKMFEQVLAGSIDEIIGYYEQHPEKIKGEFVVLIRKKA